MTALMAHLLDEGRVRRPVLLAGDGVNVDGVQREAIFRRELVMRGVPFSERRRVAAGLHRVPAREAMERLFARGLEFDALVSVNDAIALAALDVLHERGLRAPDDVLVSGFDDVPASAHADLTTVAQDLRGQGRAAARALVELAQGRPVRDVLVPSTLVVRGSSCTRARGATRPAAPEEVDASAELRDRLGECGDRRAIERLLEELLPPAGLGRPALLSAGTVTWPALEAHGSCVAVQALGSRDRAGAVVYDPSGARAPALADVLKRALSRRLDELAADS
jgi:hypothetical protein